MARRRDSRRVGRVGECWAVAEAARMVGLLEEGLLSEEEEGTGISTRVAVRRVVIAGGGRDVCCGLPGSSGVLRKLSWFEVA